MQCRPCVVSVIGREITMDSEMHSHSMIRRHVIGLMAGLAVLWLFAAGFGLSVME